MPAYTTPIDPNICIGNTLSTFNANFKNLDTALNLINNYTSERVAFAWGLYNTAISAMESGGSYNLTGESDAVGQYTFSFTVSAPNANYIVLLNAASDSGVDSALRGQIGYTHTKTTTEFEVDWGTVGANANPDFLNVLVYSI